MSNPSSTTRSCSASPGNQSHYLRTNLGKWLRWLSILTTAVPSVGDFHFYNLIDLLQVHCPPRVSFRHSSWTAHQVECGHWVAIHGFGRLPIAPTGALVGGSPQSKVLRTTWKRGFNLKSVMTSSQEIPAINLIRIFINWNHIGKMFRVETCAANNFQSQWNVLIPFNWPYSDTLGIHSCAESVVHLSICITIPYKFLNKGIQPMRY